MLIQPGYPQQNTYVERYNRTVRNDWLNHYLFNSIEDVENRATQWLWIYNNERPNMVLNGITRLLPKSLLLT
jgi:putative transposase